MKKIFLILSALLFVGIASAQTYQYGMMDNNGQFYPSSQYWGGMMGMMYGNYGFGFGVLSWIFSLLVIALILAAIYFLIKSANRKK